MREMISRLLELYTCIFLKDFLYSALSSYKKNKYNFFFAKIRNFIQEGAGGGRGSQKSQVKNLLYLRLDVTFF